MCSIFSFCKLVIFLVFFVSIFISIEVRAGKNGPDSHDILQVDLLNNSSTKIEDLSYLTSKEFQELANRANMNYLAAQREILFRVYWGKRPEDWKKYIKIDRWRNLEKITKSNLGFYLILQTCTAEEISEHYNDAVTWLIERADKGNAIAQNILGVAYCLGKGVVQNYQRSVECFRAAEKACVEAQCNLAISYWLGEGVDQDQNAAIDYYCKAAERGCAAAQFHIGMAYLLGNGSTQNGNEAMKWLCKAADQCFSAAQYQLSLIYWTAQDDHRDHNKALDLLSRAASQGNVEAQYALAMAYWEGLHVKQDFITAMKWLLEATEQGFLDAQIALTGRFRCLSNAPFGGKEFSCYSKCTLESIELMLKRHCMLCGVNNPSSSLEGAEFAVPGLLDSFDKITHFESLLLKLLIDLNRLEAGFMISCFKPNQEIIDALSQRDSSHIHWDSGAGLLTIGEHNVRTARLLNRLLTSGDFKSVEFLLNEYSNMPKLRIQAELLDIQRRAKTTPEDVGEDLKNEFQLKITAYNELVENPTDEMKLVAKEVKILADLRRSLQRFIREGTAFRNDRFLMEYSYFNIEE